MSFDNTVTEQELDHSVQQAVKGIRMHNSDVAQDLSVDGLSESIFVKLFRALSFRRS